MITLFQILNSIFRVYALMFSGLHMMTGIILHSERFFSLPEPD
jgi:hypothetical protein